MVPILAILVLALSAADHWTTYLCLHQPVGGWQVEEANPLAAWLFDAVGLAEGLLLDSLFTVLAVGFLLSTRRLSEPVKAAFLFAVVTWTLAAVINNVGAIDQLGLSLLG